MEVDNMSEKIKVNTVKAEPDADAHAALWRALKLAATAEANASAHTNAAIVACGRAGLTYGVAPDDVAELVTKTNYSRATRIDKIVSAFGYTLATELDGPGDVETFAGRFGLGRMWVNDAKSIRQTLGMDGTGSNRAEDAEVIGRARELGLTLDNVAEWKSILTDALTTSEPEGDDGEAETPAQSDENSPSGAEQTPAAPKVEGDSSGPGTAVQETGPGDVETGTASVSAVPTVAAIVAHVNDVADALHRHRQSGTDVTPALLAIGALTRAMPEAEREQLATVLAESIGKVLRAKPKPAAPKRPREPANDADTVRKGEVAVLDKARKTREALLTGSKSK
jgi:hypothetical protein